jgi:hypothetical protein
MTTTFPAYNPTDRRYVHGEWPMKRHKFMANTEQRTLYATTKTGQELRLVYANQSTNVVETFMFHYNAMFGTQYAFDVPRQALVGWDGGTAVMGLNQKWRYKQAPRITSQKGLLATLEVTLVTANVQDLVLENVGTQSTRTAEPRQLPTPRTTTGGDLTAYPSPNDPTKCFYLDPTKTYKSHWFKASIQYEYQACDYNPSAGVGGCTGAINSSGTNQTDRDTAAAGPIPHRLEQTRFMSKTPYGPCYGGDTFSEWKVYDANGTNISPFFAGSNDRKIISNGTSGTFCSDLDTGSDPILQYYIEIPSGEKIYPVNCPGEGDVGGGGGGGDCCGGGNGGVDSGFPIAPPQPSLPPTNPPPPINDDEDEPIGSWPGGGGGGGPDSGTPPPPEENPFDRPDYEQGGCTASDCNPCAVRVDHWRIRNRADGIYYDKIDLAGASLITPMKVTGYWYELSYINYNDGNPPRLVANPYISAQGFDLFPEGSDSGYANWRGEDTEFCKRISRPDNAPEDYLEGFPYVSVKVRGLSTGPSYVSDYSWGAYPTTIYQARISPWPIPGRDVTCTTSCFGPMINGRPLDPAYLSETTLDEVCGGGLVEYPNFNPIYIPFEWRNANNQSPETQAFNRRLRDTKNLVTTQLSLPNSRTFPRVHPSTRTYSLSDWNSKRFAGGKSSQQLTLALPSAAVDSGSKLQLVFANRHDAVARAILDHYHELNGSYKAFHLSDEVLADWNSVYRERIRGAEWTYEAPPQVVSSHINTSTTSVRLVMTKSGRS